MYEVLRSEAEVRELIEWHNANSEWVCLDLETTGLDSFNDEVVDVQISGKTPETVAIFPGSWISCLRSLSSMPVGHNLRFDITFLYRKGVDVTAWKYRDTMLLAHLENENRDSYSLDSLIKEFYGEEASHKEEFWKKYKTYQEAPEQERWAYGALDVRFTGLLYCDLRERCIQQGIPPSLCEHVHRLQYALLKTEVQGVKVDQDYLVNLGVNLKSQIEDLLPRMREMVAVEADLVEARAWLKELAKFKTDKRKAREPRPQFSFDSPKQLQALLYDCLGLPPQYNEKTKAISVDDAALEQLKGLHPVVPLIQQYRADNKIYGTYVTGTLERTREGRIYPTFRLVDDDSGMKTSRISHRDPNLAQLPKTGGIRGIYIPDEDEVFSDHDYKQLEVCIEAHYTGDKNLLEIVLKGASKHDITAHNLGIPRDLAKTLNFASQYFCSHKKMAKILGVSEQEGMNVYRKYWETYAGVKAFKDQTDKEVYEQGFVVDWFGRKRRFPVPPRWEGDKILRQAYNFKVQSTGGQLMNNSYYKADEWIVSNGRGSGGKWTVHDSGLFSHKRQYHEENAEKVNEIMINEGVLSKLTVPLAVDFVTGCTRWED